MKLLGVLHTFVILLLSTSSYAVIGGVELTQSASDSTPGDHSIVAILGFALDADGKKIDTAAPMVLCSGVLIADDMVLTAAHCVPDRYVPAVVFYHDIRDNAARREVHSPIIWTHIEDHPPSTAVGYELHYIEYNHELTTSDDLAIIRFKGPLPPGYKSLPLLTDSKLLHAGVEVRLAGFGLTSASNPSSNAVLHGAQAIISQLVFPDSTGNATSLLFTGDIVCDGDSGGPVLLTTGGKTYLAGVNVYIDAPACGSGSSYAVSVASQIKWINDQMRSLEAAK